MDQLEAIRYLTRQKVGKAKEEHEKALRGKVRNVCDAADVVGDGIYCRIEENLITPVADPNTVTEFCLGDCTKCPTLRLSKSEGGSTATTFTQAARRARAKVEAREEAWLADFQERFGGIE